MKLMEAEGVVFKCNVTVGQEVKGSDLIKDFDAVLFATGATNPRNLPIPGELSSTGLALSCIHGLYAICYDMHILILELHCPISCNSEQRERECSFKLRLPRQ